MKRKRDGFTLVELMVVAVIVAILAAVAIPLMSANKTRAIATEAEAGCGTIRTALRAMYAETGDYSVDLNKVGISKVTDIPGIGPTDLDGKYFDTGCYKLSNLGATTYTITATGADSSTTDKADAKDIVVTLNQDGKLTKQLEPATP